MDDSTTARRLREPMAKFSVEESPWLGVLCDEVGKVGSRFVREMVCGI